MIQLKDLWVIPSKAEIFGETGIEQLTQRCEQSSIIRSAYS
jgi:hypothetical protein